MVCSATDRRGRASESDELARWLPGVYDTFEQADADAARGAQYRHVRAVLRIVRLEGARLGFGERARVFYLEQALAETPAEPYRQRILVLEQERGHVVLAGHRIADPADLVGAGPELLNTIEAGRIRREAGCEMTWARAGAGLYVGASGAGRTCRTTLRGAAWVVSSAALTATALVSLDQGFDESGTHCWGPPPGEVGHIFRKRGGAGGH